MKFPDDYFTISSEEHKDLGRCLIHLRSRLIMRACNFPCGGRLEKLQYSTQLTVDASDWTASRREWWRLMAADEAIRTFQPPLQEHLKKIEILLYPPRMIAAAKSGFVERDLEMKRMSEELYSRGYLSR